MAGYWERREERYERAGQAVGSMLKDRWDGKEAEEFIQNELATYQATTAEFNNSLTAITDGDQMAAAFSKWQSDTTAWSATATAKYSNNPRIMEMVKNIMDKQTESLGQYIQVEEYGHQRGRREEMEERGAQEFETGQALTGAKTEQALGAAAESRARAGAIRAKPDLTQFPQVGTATPLDQVRQAVRNARVSHREQIATIESRIDQRAVHGKIQQRFGELKPDGKRWGDDPTKDVQDVQSEWMANPARDKTLEAGIAQELGYNLENSQGYYDDVAAFLGGEVRTPGEKIRLIKAGTPTRNVLSRLFVQEVRDLEAKEWNVETVESFIKNTLADLPTTTAGYQQLGPHVTTMLEQAVKKDADGQVTGSDGTPVKNFGELGRHMVAFWGAETSTKLVDPDATKQQEDTVKVGRAIIAKFAPVIAQRLGIPLPPAMSKKLQREGEPAFLQLLRGIEDVVTGAPGFLGIGGREEL